nr:type 4a pilus biogenesis protein PilO [Desulfobulbaceae bacterium]
MNRLNQIIALIRTRNGLFVVVGILAALNIGRFAYSKYIEVRDGIESKQALHDQYQISTQSIDSLRNRIRQLEERRDQFDRHLFSGTSAEEIASAMQLKLQELLGAAGLSPESLRPLTKSSGKDEEKLYGEVIVKIRLSGDLEGFLKFLSSLYKLNYFFKIENFTLKPFKTTELKIFLELKGFYRLTKVEKK